MLVPGGETCFDIVIACDEDERRRPFHESAFEFDFDRVSVKQTEEECEAGDLFGSEFIEDGNGLSVVAIEPPEASRGNPDIIQPISEHSSTLKSAPCLTNTGFTVDPEYHRRG